MPAVARPGPHAIAWRWHRRGLRGWFSHPPRSNRLHYCPVVPGFSGMTRSARSTALPENAVLPRVSDPGTQTAPHSTILRGLWAS